jgi:uncharacterized protein YbbC (DUF1343 family)
MKIALVTNQTGKDTCGRRNIDILRARGLKLACILTPEHGLDGLVPAGVAVDNTKDRKTGIPVLSLYGHRAGKKIGRNILDNVDVFLIDLQDCGMRHFTYISTLYSILESASHYNKRVIILDRPNLLGNLMEGPLVEPDLFSFVSIASIPVRHGMTMGELALYFNDHCFKKKARVQVITMQGYNRDCNVYGTLLAPLSPNIASIQACYGYSFLGLLGECRPFEVGIKLHRPFQVIMLPESTGWKDKTWAQLAHALKMYGIDATLCTTCCGTHNTKYRGLQLYIPRISETPSFQVLLTIIDFARDHGLPMDISALGIKAFGTKKIVDYLAGRIKRNDLATFINLGLEKFYRKARTCFLYNPWPRITLVH